MDFHWGEYEYKLQGEGEILFSQILQLLHIEEITIEDVADISFSDPDLVRVEKVEGKETIQNIADRVYDALTNADNTDDSEDNGSDEESSTTNEADAEDIEGIDYSERDDEEGSAQDDSEETAAGYDIQSLDVTWDIDWLLTSLKAFNTNETLTLTLKNGETVTLEVTDAQTVNYKGFKYTINGSAATLSSRVSNTGAVLTGFVPVSGAYVPVTSIPYNVFAPNKEALFSIGKDENNQDGIVDRIFTDVDVPDLVTWNSIAASDNVNVRTWNSEANSGKGGWDTSTQAKSAMDSAQAGAKNNDSSSKSKMWKETAFNEATGNLELTLSFFEDQGRPIDFIFVSDETGTMYTNYATATTRDGKTLKAPRFVWGRSAMIKATQALLNANETKGYDNQVSFVVWDHNARNKSSWFGTNANTTAEDAFNAANQWLGQTYTNHGGTHHYQAIQAVLEQISSGREDAVKVVVYMSDFADGGTGHEYIRYNGERNRARNLLNKYAQVYALDIFNRTESTMTLADKNRMTRYISQQGHNYWADPEDPSKILDAFQEIITDAVSNMDTDMSFKDELSTEIKTQAGGTDISWELNDGTTTMDVDGETVTTVKPLKTGTLYRRTFTIPVNGGDKVYSGNMPTNGDAMVLQDGNGEPLNSISAADSPTLKIPVKFVLGLKDSNGYTETKIGGIGFKIQELDATGNSIMATEKTKTTSTASGSEGEFIVPYNTTDGFLFEKGKKYRLTEDSDTVNTYNTNAAANNQKQIYSAVSWTLTVNDDYTISSEVDNSAAHTPEMTISNGVFHIWNEEKVEAKLIPITVKKEWSGNGPHFNVPFTVYGTYKENGTTKKVALKAYSSDNESTAEEVTKLTAANRTSAEGVNPEVWERQVWVYSMDVAQHKFYEWNTIGNKYPNYAKYDFPSTVTAETEIEQKYNYVIEEGDYKNEYKYGYYEKNEGKAISSSNGSADPKDPVAEWVDIGTSNATSYEAQLHLNVAGFILNQNVTNGNDYDKYPNDEYAGWPISVKTHSKNEMYTPTNLYKHMRYIELELSSNASGADPSKVRYRLKVTNDILNNDGVLIQGIRLPQSWYYSADVRGIDQTGNIDNISVTKLTFIDDANPSQAIDIYGGINSLPNGPNATLPRWRLVMERKGYNSTGHDILTASLDDTCYAQKWTIPSQTITSPAEYTINSCTLTMTNTEIPLQPVTVRKEWKNTPPIQKQSVTLDITGSYTSGGSVVLPVYDDANRSTEPSDPINRVTLTSSDAKSGDADVWEKTVFIPEYASVSGDINAYSANESTLVVKQDPDVQGDPGRWADTVYPDYIAGKAGQPDGKIEVEPAHPAGVRTYSPEPVETKYVVITVRGRRRINGRTTTYSLKNLGQVQLNYTLNGTQYWDTVRLDRSYTFTNETILDKSYYIPITYQSGEAARSIKLSSISGTTFKPAEDFYGDGKVCTSISLENNAPAGATLITNSYSYTHQKEYPATEAVYDTVPGVSATPGVVTAVNEFVANNVITLQSKFVDETGDSASTSQIKSVRYTVTPSVGDPFTVDIPIGNGQTGEKMVYVPDGDFTVTQDSYTLNDNTVVSLAANNPYTTTVQKRTDEMDGADDDHLEWVYQPMTFPARGSDEPVIRFDNVRKNYPIYVQMDWHDAVDLNDANDDPFRGNNPDFTLSLANSAANPAVTRSGVITYKNADSNVTGSVGPVTVDAMPAYDVYGVPVQITISGQGMEERLPDFDVTSNIEETGVGGNPVMIHTFSCIQKKAMLYVSKFWDIETTPPASLSVVLKKVKKNGAGQPVEETVWSGSLTEVGLWETTKENLTVSKSYLAEDYEEYYVLTEITPEGYKPPSYIDLSPDASHAFEVLEENGTTSAKFKLTPEGESLSITNRELTTSFTISKTWVDGDNNALDPAIYADKTVAVELWGVKGKGTVPNSDIAINYTQQLDSGTNYGAKTVQQRLKNTHGENNLEFRDFGTYYLSSEDKQEGVNTWNKTINDLPRSYVYYAVETEVDGEVLTSDGDNAIARYNPEYVFTRQTATEPGSVTITNHFDPIARVIVDDGTTQVIGYFDYLVHETYGAFNYADSITNGTVTIELLKASHNRYTLTASGSNSGFTFDKKVDMTLRTIPGASFTSEIKRGANFGTLIKVDGPTAFTLETITLDGEKESYTSNENGGLINIKAGTLNIKEGTTLRNSRAADNNNKYGGAVMASDRAVVNMSGGTISNCSADNEGGGIKTNDSTLNITGGTITGCSAAHGGGIHAYSGETTISAGTISECTVTGCGGGLYNYGGTVNVNGTAIIDSCKAGWDGTAFRTDDNGKGGGIDNGLGSGSVTIAGSVQIKDCQASYGGGTYVEAGATTNINGGTIDNCYAAVHGGGVFVESKDNKNGTLSVGTATISDCRTDGNGGAIYNDSSNALTISGLTINGHDQSKTTKLSDTTTNATAGGGIYMNAGTLSLTNSYIYNCIVAAPNEGSTASDTFHSGGAIYCNSSSIPTGGVTISLSGTTINGHFNGLSDSVLNARDGGAIYMEQGTLSISGTSELVNCYVHNKGGAIYTKHALTVTGSTISGNKCTNTIASGNGAASATNKGGGVYFNANSEMLTLDRVTIGGENAADANSAYMGGGVYVALGGLTLKNTTVMGNKLTNTTTTNAAGIYLADGLTLTIGGGTGDDTSTVMENKTSNDNNSDVRLWESGGKNADNSVSVLSNLTGTIKVVNAKTVFKQFGTATAGANFAFLSNAASNTMKNIQSEDGNLYARYETGSDTKVIWYGTVRVKITDADGYLLYRSNGDQAVYNTLEEALIDFKGGSFKDSENAAANPIEVQMLVPDYPLERILLETEVFKENETVTITTASKSPVDNQFPYRGTESDGDRCTIRTTSSTKLKNKDGGNPPYISMIRLTGGTSASKPGTTLILRDIIIDGGGESVTWKGDGGIIKANKYSKVILDQGAELCNGVNKNANGGGICIQTGATLLMKGNAEIHDCTSKTAGAVYIDAKEDNKNETAMFMCGTSRIYNSISETEGAVGINKDKNPTKAKLYVGESATIYDNADKSGHQRNVVLKIDNNGFINTWNSDVVTTERITGINGLNEDAKIGVFVLDGDTLYKKHGKYEMDFGTRGSSTDDNLDCFVNDRNGLYGVACTHAGDSGKNYIMWQSYLCKLTDSERGLLYTRTQTGTDDSGNPVYLYKPALYDTLNAAFNAAKSVGADGIGTVTLYKVRSTPNTADPNNPTITIEEYTYTAGGSNQAIHVEMLKNYTMPEDDKIANDVERDLTLTTSVVGEAAGMLPGGFGDAYEYVYSAGEHSDWPDGDQRWTCATITRKSDFTANSMFTHSVAKNFATEDIILDGNNVSVTENGGIISTSIGTVKVQGGTTMKNSKSSSGSGGAIYAKDVQIDNATGHSGTVLFDNCRAEGNTGGGGAIYFSNSFHMDDNAGSIRFENCTTGSPNMADGGAISNWENKQTTFTALRNEGTIQFLNCHCDGSQKQGGAIFVYGKKGQTTEITITNLAGGRFSFENCYADGGSDNNAGGAISGWEAVNVTLTGSDAESVGFNNCQATGKTGGAIYADGTVTVSNAKFEKCTAATEGGAICAVGNVTLTNVRFGALKADSTVDAEKVCHAGGSGGVVYSGGTVTYTSTVTTPTGCFGSHGSSGGAIYASGAVKMDGNSGKLLFVDCHSSGTGGAIYTSSVSMDSNSGTLSFDGCYTADNAAHGGAVRADNGLSMNGNSGTISFEDCHSGKNGTGSVDADGGAIAVYAAGKTLSATDNTGLISFDNCTTSNGTIREGGAIILLGGNVTMESEGDGRIVFKECYANASGESDANKVAGGAICTWNSSTSAITLTGTTAHPITFEGCHSNGAGGAVANRSTGAITLTNVVFNDCYAEGNIAYGGSVCRRRAILS